MGFLTSFNNQGELYKDIRHLRSIGISNTEVFAQLKTKYTSVDVIARGMASTPEQKNIDQFKGLQLLVIGLLIAFIGITLWCLNCLHTQQIISTNKFYINMAITLLIGAVSMYLTVKNRPAMGSLTFLLFIIFMSKFSALSDLHFGLFIGSLFALSIVRTIYVHKICPNFFFGRARKNRDDEYILD